MIKEHSKTHSHLDHTMVVIKIFLKTTFIFIMEKSVKCQLSRHHGV